MTGCWRRRRGAGSGRSQQQLLLQGLGSPTAQRRKVRREWAAIGGPMASEEESGVRAALCWKQDTWLDGHHPVMVKASELSY